MVVAFLMIMSLASCGTGAEAVASETGDASASFGATSHEYYDSEENTETSYATNGITGYDDVSYDPARDYTVGDNCMPIVDDETSTWSSGDVHMGDMVHYCLNDIAYDINGVFDDHAGVVRHGRGVRDQLVPLENITDPAFKLDTFKHIENY